MREVHWNHHRLSTLPTLLKHSLPHTHKPFSNLSKHIGIQKESPDDIMKETVATLILCTTKECPYLTGKMNIDNQPRLAYLYSRLFEKFEFGIRTDMKRQAIQRFYQLMLNMSINEKNIVFKGIWKCAIKHCMEKYSDIIEGDNLFHDSIFADVQDQKSEQEEEPDLMDEAEFVIAEPPPRKVTKTVKKVIEKIVPVGKGISQKKSEDKTLSEDKSEDRPLSEDKSEEKSKSKDKSPTKKTSLTKRVFEINSEETSRKKPVKTGKIATSSAEQCDNPRN